MDDERRLTIEGVTSTPQLTVRNVYVIDKSGSMQDVAASTIVGFNEEIQSMKQTERENPMQRYTCTLVTFNGRVDVQFEDRPTSELVELNSTTYVPNGGTALFDAVGQTVTKLLAEIPADSTDRVVITIMTDGDERNSCQFNESQTRDLITQARARGWVVNFVGSAESAMKSAHSLGIAAGNTAMYAADAGGTQEVFRSMSAGRTRYAAGLTQGLMSRSGDAMRGIVVTTSDGTDISQSYMSGQVNAALNLRDASNLACERAALADADEAILKHLLSHASTSQTPPADTSIKP